MRFTRQIKDEQLYGLVIMIGSLGQPGLKNRPIVNDAPVFVNNNPLVNIGYTHAPQPFFVSTEVYGVLINTSRFVTFLCGTNKEKRDLTARDKTKDKLKFSTRVLYENQPGETWKMWIGIPDAGGDEILFFQGEYIK